jgi:tRNA-specific 2-thiouridylase
MSATALVAMSGGVDSSVAAALMLEAGYDVVGVTLKQWEGPDGEMPTAGCCTVGDAVDARSVAARLGVPYYVLDYVDEFRIEVVDRFGAAYLAGLTPNPCIECNRRVRFDALLERTAALGCDVLVTGHHARVHTGGDGARHLLRAVDRAKDQSYVLHMLDQRALARVRLPIGEMTKDEVRARAAELGLRTASKPDSQDLCFVGKGDGGYRAFIRRHFPQAARAGHIVDTSGAEVGEHAGAVDFTVGQRRGLGLAVRSGAADDGDPRYVVAVDAATATVTIGRKRDLEVGGCRLEDVSFVSGSPPSDPEVTVKVRYRADPAAATVSREDGSWVVRFDAPLHAVAPGQAAVLYRGDEVLGGGTIVATFG